jgi:transposase
MEREVRNNSGVLFKSDKRDNERAPHYKGNITVDGKDYWLSAWIKDGKSGKFMGLAVSPKEAQPAPVKASNSVADMESDIPF